MPDGDFFRQLLSAATRDFQTCSPEGENRTEISSVRASAGNTAMVEALVGRMRTLGAAPSRSDDLGLRVEG
jgi:hypothetical protein